MKTLKEISLPKLRRLVQIKERIAALEAEANAIVEEDDAPPKRKVKHQRKVKPESAKRTWTPEAKAKLSKSMRKVWKHRHSNSALKI